MVVTASPPGGPVSVGLTVSSQASGQCSPSPCLVSPCCRPPRPCRALKRKAWITPKSSAGCLSSPHCNQWVCRDTLDSLVPRPQRRPRKKAPLELFPLPHRSHLPPLDTIVHMHFSLSLSFFLCYLAPPQEYQLAWGRAFSAAAQVQGAGNRAGASPRHAA